ncbi:hypothetical protein KS4_27690 [Poriferisphaera corsica]|uniref:Uncharacterized protein n=1 Tax=Poriferisphaera corsica TaxID=2528020 RepID=A0A517YWT5_9BACT|nr:hypothetical protein [Poriferisphaera corsica]QDU34695.1 hypothetical protein KS4_27690 [Poriferisphaera corsica]
MLHVLLLFAIWIGMFSGGAICSAEEYEQANLDYELVSVEPKYMLELNENEYIANITPVVRFDGLDSNEVVAMLHVYVKPEGEKYYLREQVWGLQIIEGKLERRLLHDREVKYYQYEVEGHLLSLPLEPRFESDDRWGTSMESLIGTGVLTNHGLIWYDRRGVSEIGFDFRNPLEPVPFIGADAYQLILLEGRYLCAWSQHLKSYLTHDLYFYLVVVDLEQKSVIHSDVYQNDNLWEILTSQYKIKQEVQPEPIVALQFSLPNDEGVYKFLIEYTQARKPSSYQVKIRDVWKTKMGWYYEKGGELTYQKKPGIVDPYSWRRHEMNSKLQGWSYGVDLRLWNVQWGDDPLGDISHNSDLQPLMRVFKNPTEKMLAESWGFFDEKKLRLAEIVCDPYERDSFREYYDDLKLDWHRAWLWGTLFNNQQIPEESSPKVVIFDISSGIKRIDAELSKKTLGQSDRYHDSSTEK